MKIRITANNVHVDYHLRDIEFFPTENQRDAASKIMNYLEDTEKEEAFHASKEGAGPVVLSLEARYGELTQYHINELPGTIRTPAQIIGRFLHEHERQTQLVNAG